MLDLIPGNNQYLAMKVNFLAQRNNTSLWWGLKSKFADYDPDTTHWATPCRFCHWLIDLVWHWVQLSVDCIWHEHQQGTNTNIVKCTILIKPISKWHFPEINRYHVFSNCSCQDSRLSDRLTYNWSKSDFLSYKSKHKTITLTFGGFRDYFKYSKYSNMTT